MMMETRIELDQGPIDRDCLSCWRRVGRESFRDDRGWKRWTVMSLCQACQDAFDDACPPQAIDASELGWAPGHWPVRMVRGDATYARAGVLRREDGEVIGVRYIASDASELHVMND